MGSHHSKKHCAGLDLEELNNLVDQTKLSQKEVKEQWVKFRGMTCKGDTMDKETFSKILHQCFPRTYKVIIFCKYLFNFKTIVGRA